MRTILEFIDLSVGFRYLELLFSSVERRQAYRLLVHSVDIHYLALLHDKLVFGPFSSTSKYVGRLRIVDNFDCELTKIIYLVTSISPTPYHLEAF
jgi:hypothetical protein